MTAKYYFQHKMKEAENYEVKKLHFFTASFYDFKVFSPCHFYTMNG